MASPTFTIENNGNFVPKSAKRPPGAGITVQSSGQLAQTFYTYPPGSLVGATPSTDLFVETANTDDSYTAETGSGSSFTIRSDADGDWTLSIKQPLPPPALEAILEHASPIGTPPVVSAGPQNGTLNVGTE